MKSLGRKPDGARLERIKASPRWAGEGFRNVHTIIPGLRDPNASMPTLGEFLCGGERRVPRAPALKALALLGGGAFLPIHWGTFALAMHAWDQPAEALLKLGPKAGAQLMMPRLGEPAEPAHERALDPWWRAVDTAAPRQGREKPVPTTLPKSMSWPID